MNILLVKDEVDSRGLEAALNECTFEWARILTMRPHQAEVLREARRGRYDYGAVVLEMKDGWTLQMIVASLVRIRAKWRIVVVGASRVESSKRIKVVSDMSGVAQALL